MTQHLLHTSTMDQEGSGRYINEDYSLNLDPPSPTQQSYDFDYNAADYHNSPFSDHSELSYTGDDYNPAEYDHPVAANSLLMFSDSDYVSYTQMSSYADYSSPSDNGDADQQRSRASSVSSQHLHPSPRLDVAHSFENMSFQSPSWGTEPLPEHRRMSITKPQSPPRLLMPDSDQSYEQNAPPTINAPDGDDSNGGPKLRIVPATPVSGGGLGGGNETMPFARGASLLPTPNNLGIIEDPVFYGASTNTTNNPSNTPPSSGTHPPDPYTSNPSPPATSSISSQPQHRPSQNHTSVSASASQANFLFPNPAFRSRSKSDPPAPAWMEGGIDESTLMTMDELDHTTDNTVRMHDISSSLPRGQHAFLSPDLVGLRRAKSDAMSTSSRHTRQSRSEDFRGLLAVPGAQQGLGLGLTTSGLSSSADDFLMSSRQYLSPMEPPPSIRSHGHSQSFSGQPSNSLGLGGMSIPVGGGPAPGRPTMQGHVRRGSSGSRSERGAGSWGISGSPDPYGGGYERRSSSPYGSNRVSPYPSPNASPRPRYDDLPRDDALDGLGISSSYPNGGYSSQNGSRGPSPIPGQTPSLVTVGGTAVPLAVSKQNVTTGRTAKASHNRRKQEATFVCPVPGCGSTFTRSFNLKGQFFPGFEFVLSKSS